MDKALTNLQLLFGKDSALRTQKYLEAIRHLPKANKVFRYLAKSPDKEQAQDYLAIINYTLIFVSCGFQVEFEPLGDKGPDLGITRDGNQLVVEITRFRKVYPGPPVFDLNENDSTLSKYGDPGRDIRKAFEKILQKFGQLENKLGIIAIWNNEGDLDEFETRQAVDDITRDASKGILKLPKDLLFVLFRSDWITLTGKQLYCYPFRTLEEPYQTWINEFEMDRVTTHLERALILLEKTAKK